MDDRNATVVNLAEAQEPKYPHHQTYYNQQDLSHLEGNTPQNTIRSHKSKKEDASTGGGWLFGNGGMISKWIFSSNAAENNNQHRSHY